MPIYKRGKGFLVSVGSNENRVRKSFKTLEAAQQFERMEGLIREGVVAPQAAPEIHTRGTPQAKPLGLL